MFSRQQIADACRTWGPSLAGNTDIDGIRLLWAISGCESSFGQNCPPRHEAAFDVGGRYCATALVAKYGPLGASSFGPWQIMLVNCSQPAGPDDFEDADFAARQTINFINSRIMLHEKATTVAQVADAYNSGDWRDGNVPQRYIDQCQGYYDSEPMPDPIALPDPSPTSS
jgi:hypothetical protein